MIGKLRKWFQAPVEITQKGSSFDSVQLSITVLLIEIARADHNHSDVETDKIRQQLRLKFDLSDDEIIELIAVAEEAAEQSVSLHDYTKTLHSQMSYPEKEAVIEMLWEIALADRDLDKYEDYMIGKIAELLYVYRGDVMRLKQRAMESVIKAGEPDA